ncbi:MAG: SH3 domain-containing protein [Flammeovirgaceae bacterium]
MKKLIFFFFFLPFITHAQINPGAYFQVVKEYSILEEMPNYYLLADSVLLRKCPSKDCTAVDVAPIGTRLTLLAKSANKDTLNGLVSEWYQVQTDAHKAWVWGGFIAQQAFGSNGDPDVKFVMGWKSQKELTRTFQIRALRFGKEIDRLTFPAWANRVYPNDIQNLGNKGLPVDDVISFRFPCEGGCGCQTAESIIFWDGQKLHHADALTGTGDAWASGGHYFIYPSDMEGIRGTLIRVYQGYEDTEYKNGKERHKNSTKKTYLRWNGKKLVPTGRKTEELYYYQK